MIKESTLKWARSHDWGRDAYLDEDHSIRGLADVRVDLNGTVTECEAVFASRGALREWAGY